MPIYDLTKVDKVYRGTTEIIKMYVGSQLVWEKKALINGPFETTTTSRILLAENGIPIADAPNADSSQIDKIEIGVITIPGTDIVFMMPDVIVVNKPMSAYGATKPLNAGSIVKIHLK